MRYRVKSKGILGQNKKTAGCLCESVVIQDDPVLGILADTMLVKMLDGELAGCVLYAVPEELVEEPS